MKKSDRREGRDKKHTLWKILSGVGMACFPLLAAGFLFMSFISVLAGSLPPPQYPDPGVSLRGVSCSAEEIRGISEAHEVRVYGSTGGTEGVWRGLPATAESAYMVKNTSALPVSAEFYLCYTGENSIEAERLSDVAFPEASFRGEKPAGKRYVFPRYSFENNFDAVKNFASSRYELSELPSQTPLKVYEILPERGDESHYLRAEIDYGRTDYVFYTGYGALSQEDGKITLGGEIEGAGEEGAQPLRLYYTGTPEIRAATYADPSLQTPTEKAPNEKTWKTTVGGMIEERAEELSDKEYTALEAYNLTAWSLEKSLYSRVTAIDRFRICDVGAIAAWTAKLQGGETAAWNIRSTLWTTRDDKRAKKCVYTLEYGAGNLDGFARRTIFLKSELFVAQTSGAELIETLPPSSAVRAGSAVKNAHGWGRYSLTNRFADFDLYEKAELTPPANTRFLRVGLFFGLSLLCLALFIVCVAVCVKLFGGPRRPSENNEKM